MTGQQLRRNARVAVIGAGFSGIASAIALIRDGIDDFTIFESAQGIGGTWWHNRYPGAEVDLESHIYSYSYEPYDWSRTHANWSEILQYLNHVAEKWDLGRRTRLREEVLSASWSDTNQTYRLVTTSGVDHGEFDAVISCVGFLNLPQVPSFARVEHPFTGVAAHTSRWPEGLTLDDKRVAVLGTGSSGVQIVSEAAQVAKRVTVYQTTPNWIVPKNSRDFTAEEREQYRNHDNYFAERQRLYDWYDELQQDSSHARVDGHWNQLRAQQARDYMLRELDGRPELIELLTPDFRFEARRTVNSDDYYQAVRSPNVEIVPFAAKEFTETGIRDTNNDVREFDVVVFATGFDASNYLGGIKIEGRNGQNLHGQWNGEPTAMLGMMVPEFPNFFMLYGPNTNSIPLPTFYETQAEFVADTIAALCDQNAATVEVDKSKFIEFNEWLQGRLGLTVWGEVRNYFQAGSGKIVSQWPDSPSTYMALVEQTKREGLHFSGNRSR